MDDAYIARPCITHTIKLTVSLNAIDFFIKYFENVTHKIEHCIWQSNAFQTEY